MPESTQEQLNLRLKVLERTGELVTAAFGLVAALAWNDAIQTLFKQVFGEAASLYAKFFYAIVVTIIVVSVTVRLSSAQRALEQKIAKR